MKKYLKYLSVVAFLSVSSLFISGCEDDWWISPDDEYDDVLVNPDYVPIDWETSSVLSSDDSTGDYQIRFDGEIPDIQPGSIIAIDMDTTIHYRFVTSVNVSGNTVSVASVEAYLTDIFYNSRFTLATSSSAKSNCNGPVFYPVKAYVADAKGEYKEMYLNGKDFAHFTEDLWSQTLFDLSGLVLYTNEHLTLYMQDMSAALGVDLEMVMHFGEKNNQQFVGDILRNLSDLVEVSGKLIGKFETNQIVRCDIEGDYQFAPEYDLWKHNLFRPVKLTFIVGGVPVPATLRCDLFRQVAASAEGDLSFYTGFTYNAEGHVGIEWNENTGVSLIPPQFSSQFQSVPPTVEGHGELAAKVWAFPRVSVMLGDLVGPSFDFKPYLADTLRGGFREQLAGQNNDYYAWSLGCHAGMDVSCGLSLRCFGYEVGNLSIPNIPVIDRCLYQSPKSIVHLSGRPDVGQNATVSFNVYDQNYLLNTEVLTPLPQVVKFEANGTLSSPYAIAVNGMVSVNWTPSEGDTLFAILYNTDGGVIAFDTVCMPPCNCNVPSGDWVDLGLPSGLLWATRNVGATAPEQYGDYFAWGETQPKTVYDWSTYRYYNCDNDGYCGFTKYCTDGIYGLNGFVDNLTILQPGDDAATANWGSGARTPTLQEWRELMQYTTHQWTTYNGVLGRCFTGSNGNSIFLPAAGGRWDSSLLEVGSYGNYWSSSLDTYDPCVACSFYFHSGSYDASDHYGRFCGFSVRPVRSGSQN